MKTPLLTGLALCAFAGNSVLCRMALETDSIDPASFTLIRLLAGAATLLVIFKVRTSFVVSSVSTIDSRLVSQGSWLGASLLFSYAIFFSAAYVLLETGTGALVLFASVQITMIVKSLYDGESLTGLEWIGAVTAFVGFVLLVLPGADTPSVLGFSLMTAAGVSWGFYTLAGKQSTDAIADTTFNFVKALPLSLVAFVLWSTESYWTVSGIAFAVLSGALASGVGYSIWYTVLPELKAVQAAVVQLTVPFIAAAGGVIYLAETLSLRLLFSAFVVTLGIGLVVFGRARIAKHN